MRIGEFASCAACGRALYVGDRVYGGLCDYCAGAGGQPKWKPGDRLVTRGVRS